MRDPPGSFTRLIATRMLRDSVPTPAGEARKITARHRDEPGLLRTALACTLMYKEASVENAGLFAFLMMAAAPGSEAAGTQSLKR